MATRAETVVISLDDSPLTAAAPRAAAAGPSRAPPAGAREGRRRSQQGSTSNRGQDVVDLTAIEDTADDDEVVVMRVKPANRTLPRPQARGQKRQRQPTPNSGPSASPAAAAHQAGPAAAQQAAVLQQPGLPPMPVPGFYQQLQQHQQAPQEAAGSSPVKGFGNCPICLDKMDNPSSTPCGHLFCEVCIKDAIKAQKKCPKCRKTVQMKQIHRIYPDA